MANQTDFLDLYRKLGVDPACGLIELKRAYRRRVATLHPDRPAGIPDSSDAEGNEPLQELIAQYGAAMEFHRRHGRLPGVAAPVSRFAGPGADTVRAAQRSWVAPVPPPASPHTRSRWLILLAVVATGVLLWDVAPRAMLTEATAQIPANDDGDPADSVVRPVLSIGMSSDRVRAIEGDPIATRGNRWEYGPSWIGFDHDVVTGWYSSPLRPLHVGSSRLPDTPH